MKKRTLCLALFVIASMSVIMSASAFATTLPTLLGTTPTEAKGESTTATTHLWGVTGLEGKGWLAELFWTTSTSNLGQLKLLFTNVVIKTKKCNTEGDAAGLVLFDNLEWHLVPYSTSPLRLALLVLLKEVLTIKCEGTNVKFEGDQLIPIEESSVNKKIVAKTGSIVGNSKCVGETKTKPEVAKFLNDASEEITAQIKANSGLGFENGCEEIEGAIALHPTNEIELMG